MINIFDSCYTPNHKKISIINTLSCRFKYISSSVQVLCNNAVRTYDALHTLVLDQELLGQGYQQCQGVSQDIIAAMQRTLTATTHFTMLSVSYSLYAIHRLGNKCFNLVLLYQSLQQAPVCVRMYVCVCVTNLSKFSKTVCNTMQHSSTLCNTIQLSSVTKCNHTL